MNPTIKMEKAEEKLNISTNRNKWIAAWRRFSASSFLFSSACESSETLPRYGSSSFQVSFFWGVPWEILRLFLESRIFWFRTFRFLLCTGRHRLLACCKIASYLEQNCYLFCKSCQSIDRINCNLVQWLLGFIWSK